MVAAHLHALGHARAQQQRQRAREQRVAVGALCKAPRPAGSICCADAIQLAPAEQARLACTERCVEHTMAQETVQQGAEQVLFKQ